MTLMDAPTTRHDRLEWAKTQLGREHVAAAVNLLIDAGWCVEDARDAVMYGLAASYLVAADNEEGSNA